MTNRLTFAILALVVLALIWDQMTQDGEGTLFLLRRFMSLLGWLAFWR